MELHSFALLNKGTDSVLGVGYHSFRRSGHPDQKMLIEISTISLELTHQITLKGFHIFDERTARMETTSSRKKILVLGRPKSGKISLVKALTSTVPDGLEHESTPHAGLTHSITLTTRYFSTEAGIWIDEIPDDTKTWLNEYLSEEATPVLQSLAAVILTVNPSISNCASDLELLKKLNERGDEVEWDGTCFVVGKQSQGKAVSDLSPLRDDNILEYIDLNESGENEFGGKSRCASF